MIIRRKSHPLGPLPVVRESRLYSTIGRELLYCTVSHKLTFSRCGELSEVSYNQFPGCNWPLLGSDDQKFHLSIGVFFPYSRLWRFRLLALYRVQYSTVTVGIARLSSQSRPSLG